MSSCIRPRIPVDEEGDDGSKPSASNQDESIRQSNGTVQSNSVDGAPLQAARVGLLKAMWQASFAPRFSSKPIHINDDYSRNSTVYSSFAMDDDNNKKENAPLSSEENDNKVRPSLVVSKNLTTTEQQFLENLLQSEDLHSIRKASERLADKELFPLVGNSEETDMASSTAKTTATATATATRDIIHRRESNIQQELYRLHESTTAKPKTLLRRMSTMEKEKRGKIRAGRFANATASTPLVPPLHQSNSIMSPTNDDNTTRSNSKTAAATAAAADVGKESNDSRAYTEAGSWDMSSDHDHDMEEDKKKDEEALATKSNGSNEGSSDEAWNPFGDVNSWIDGNQGVEVDGDGIPDIPNPTSNLFKILGTSANDVSAHPHVLSPPLMEGLQEFMPESLHEYHFWLKYSLVRDAPTSVTPSNPALLDMLRHCRASLHTVLAIETTTGHVFGYFSYSQPWKLQGEEFGGTKDSFVWRMRHSRNDICDSIVEQVLMESKIDVFPYTGSNGHIQQCSQDHGLLMGQGEVENYGKKGQHYGNAIRLNPNFTEVWTSSSETFGNPSLANTDIRGEKLKVANVELWALTPHSTIESAVTMEMKQLFLEENKGSADKNLDLLEILVGGTV